MKILIPALALLISTHSVFANTSVNLEGKKATSLMDLLTSQGAIKQCEHNFCNIEVKKVSCSTERTLSSASCTMTVNENSQDLDSVASNYLFDFLPFVSASKICEGSLCSIDVESISCSSERSLAEAECVINF
jgi:hypothetical protein